MRPGDPQDRGLGGAVHAPADVPRPFGVLVGEGELLGGGIAADVGVVSEGEHMCMSMRGVRDPQARTVYSQFRGRLSSEQQLGNQVFAMARSQR